MSEPIRPHPVGGVDYPRTFQELQGVVSRRSGVPELSGSVAVAGWVRVPLVWVDAGLADGEGQVDVRGVRPADVGDRGHDLPSDPDAVVDVVRGDLVPHLAEERDVRAGAAAGTGVRVL